ncbi:MAG TPA: pyridoxamine 5'-phosphate oxidase family protein [Acidimicrobiales bacterium]|nr:pyridoxamine 5'-phosphate oxidase family protein [Acidimicrobiales bacterium]
MDETHAAAELEELSHEECLELLARHDFGRIAVLLDQHQPDIFPVNYRLDGENIVFRSSTGTKLTHASLDRVAFEVDERDSSGGAWSVVVKGVAREITEALDPVSVRERNLPIETPLSRGGDHFVRIVPRAVTGRRLVPPAT